MSYVKWQDILDQTNGGLAIITDYYPHAPAAISTSSKKFKIRDEKTASASIRKKDGYWNVTDFGGDSKERNAIGVCMLEDSKDFGEACKILAARYHIKSDDANFKPVMADISRRPLTAEENAKDYEQEVKDFTEAELKILGPCVSADHCADFHLESLKNFTYCKANEASITASTEIYPIFGFVEEGWTKLYQPYSFDKQYRFRFLGQKPKRHVYGLELLKKQFNRNKKKIEEEYNEEAETESGKKPSTDPRVDYVFIVSGGSDGINLRSFGYFPIWFNSETEQISFEEYRMLQKYAKEIIYVPDLDQTGIKLSIELGLKFLDIKIMMLPEWLKKFKDRRGNPCKDFKDLVERMYSKDQPKKFNASLKKLIDNALPCEFWDSYIGKNKKVNYTVRWTQLYNFLKLQGFGRYKDEHTKEGFQFVRRQNNVVQVVRPVDIESYINTFLKDRQMPIALRDKVYATSLNDRQLSKLDHFDVDFTIADKAVQYLFFKNQVWEITGKEITRKKLGEVERFVWERKVVEHEVRLQDPQFKIFNDTDGNLDIKILNNDNNFLNYLVNASRVHWRKELEEGFSKQEDQVKYQEENKFNIAGPKLSENEQHEQKLHLINKIYAFGYMLHTYKTPQRPWAVYAMDNKMADINESHGGSGKSFFLKSLQFILKENHYINGRDNKKTQDDFIYHGVTNETNFLLVDDCHQYLDFGFFFNAITGDLDVNNKQGLRYIIPFDQSPKVAFASNYPPNKLDPSLERRILFTVFSDYYHFNKDEEYKETRSISDDFGGKSLFKEYTDEEWNIFFNFCGQAIQFYLSRKDKLDPPMGNVTKRNLLSEMGEHFKGWADVFFASVEGEDGVNLDTNVPKVASFDNFKNVTGLMRTSPQKFKKSLKAFCRMKGWNFNPEGAGTNADGRILKKRGIETIEMFYIQTKAEITVEDLHDDPFAETDTDNLKGGL